MRGLKPRPITLTERQYGLLQQILRREKSSQQQIRRARVILAAAEPSSNRDIAKRLDLTLQTVRGWRRRWLQINQACAMPSKMVTTNNCSNCCSMRSAMKGVVAGRLSSPRSKSARLLPWAANSQRVRIAPSVSGLPERWLMKPSNAAL